MSKLDGPHQHLYEWRPQMLQAQGSAGQSGDHRVPERRRRRPVGQGEVWEPPFPLSGFLCDSDKVKGRHANAAELKLFRIPSSTVLEMSAVETLNIQSKLMIPNKDSNSFCCFYSWAFYHIMGIKKKHILHISMMFLQDD